jgi:hypothetical protein
MRTAGLRLPFVGLEDTSFERPASLVAVVYDCPLIVLGHRRKEPGGVKILAEEAG